MPIYFYSQLDEHAYLSNFSPHGFALDGRYWPTVEHYFQAQKFAGRDYAERICRAHTPREAKRLGRSRAHPLRPDWETVKDDVMHRAIRRTFEAHADLRVRLLETGDERLIENAPNDAYWGCGPDGTGQNRLGEILMDVRAALRETAG